MSNPAKVVYDHLTFRLAEWGEEDKLIDFINANFDMQLPLVNNRAFFTHYYCGERLQFAIAEQDGVFVAVAGYILANESKIPDLWVSVWVALKGAMGAGLELMNALPSLTGARIVACNNIRENTCPFYRFLGWSAERLPHYYRLSKAASEGQYQLYHPAMQTQDEQSASSNTTTLARLAVTDDLALTRVASAEALAALGLPIHNEAQTPAKSIAYLQRRYFEYPYQQYDVWSVQEAGNLLAYCVTRTVQCYPEGGSPEAAGNVHVLRVVDFIGAASVLPRIGGALDTMMEAAGAEYTDCYCAGISPALFAAAGFCERTAEDTTIVPNYLTPILAANTDYFYFTNSPDGFTLFKADGDQDRPNLA